MSSKEFDPQLVCLVMNGWDPLPSTSSELFVDPQAEN